MAIPDSEEKRRDIVSQARGEEEEQQEQEVNQLPSYPRDNDDCIKPCPRFDCIMSKSKCEKNCNRREALLNPCTLCDHDCSDELQSVLIKPEVMDYQQEAKSSFPKNFLYKSEVAERIAELEEKQEKLRERVKTAKEQLDDHFLPNFLAKIVTQTKLPTYRKKLQKSKDLIEELEYNFGKE